MPGTFALELIHAANEARGADIMFTLRWSDEKNRFGVAGTQTIHSESREGVLEGDASGHGGLSPYAVRNTLILSGPAFNRGVDIDAPAGVVDITPTALALLNVTPPDAPFDGRVLREAFADATNARREREGLARRPGRKRRRRRQAPTKPPCACPASAIAGMSTKRRACAGAERETGQLTPLLGSLLGCIPTRMLLANSGPSRKTFSLSFTLRSTSVASRPVRFGAAATT